MINSPCQHAALDDIWVARCREHSQPAAGVEVWAWSTGLTSPLQCACAAADRFVVVTGDADERWTWSADVVLGSAQPSLQDAVEVAERFDQLPGCALISVPAGHGRIVFRTRTRRIVSHSDRACGICMYPWLITAGDGGPPRRPTVVGP